MKAFKFRRIYITIIKRPYDFFILFFLFTSSLYSLFLPNFMFYDYMVHTKIGEDFLQCNYSSNQGLQHDLPLCSDYLEELKYFEPVSEIDGDRSLEKLPNILGIATGGKWSPKHCTAQHRVAIVVPFRGREPQLKIFLHHMHNFLTKQLLDYQIFVVEQTSNHTFNKGIIYNAGYIEILKRSNFCCFILNDVDLLPESPRNIYTCTTNPRHLCANLNTFRYVLPYSSIFGGVVSLTKDQYRIVNGFSNEFFGWGGEDDDLYNRVQAKGMIITRWEPRLSRYKMLYHQKEDFNPERKNILRTGLKRQDEDGLSNVKYKLKSYRELPLYTWFLIELVT